VVLAAHPQLPGGVKAEDPRLDEALAALADPTRRAVLSLLASGPRRAGELAQALDMPPPSLSRHLRVLRRCGLIADDEPEHDARVRLYRVCPEAFAPVSDWLGDLESFWGDQLLAFKQHAEGRPVKRPPAKRRP